MTSSSQHRISCIGLGRVGASLMRLFAQSHAVEIGALVARDIEDAHVVQRCIGAGEASANFADIRPDDIVMLAVKDRQIRQVATDLFQSKYLTPDTIIFHCSGSLGSQVLSEVGFNRAASVHPLFSFARPEVSAEQFAGSSCSYEGNEQATKVLRSVFSALRVDLFEINPTDKSLYHAACVFASNYTTAMSAIATELFCKISIDATLATKIATDLAASSIDNVRCFGAKQGLTGPAARGDLEIIDQHISMLRLVDPDLSELYERLAKRLIAMVQS